MQIIHLKENRLTGTIPESFASLRYLSWFDISNNKLHGTIAPEFGNISGLKDFRIAGNRIYGSVPESLCQNNMVNGGVTIRYGCEGIACPLGYFSDTGHAMENIGCRECPEGQTTMYLASTECQTISEKQILSMFFDVINANAAFTMDSSSSSSTSYPSWQDGDHDNICNWNGVTCNANEEIVSFAFPARGAGQIL